MKRKWLTLLSGCLTITLAAGTLPVLARHDEERYAKRLRIEAAEGLSLRAQTTGAKRVNTQNDSALWILTFEGPVEEKWIREVERLGVELGDYLPDYSFIARISGSRERDKVEELRFVRRLQPFLPQYKTDPSLSNWSRQERQNVTVVGFDADRDISKTLRRWDGRGISRIESFRHAPRMARLTVTRDALDELVASDEIIAVLPEPKRKAHNNVAAEIIASDRLAATGYTGKGQIVGVADSGLDTGDKHRIHPDLQGRIKSLYAAFRPGDASDPTGHGTHVAGSIVGNGAASDGKVRGMAPDAQLVFHAVGDENGGIYLDVTEVLEEAYDDGARIHSDSWGSSDNGGYSADSIAFDRFLWEHKDMTALVAAGNDGEEGYYTVGSPATAKNVIAVGASESKRDFGDDIADNPYEVAEFSSRGPTEDGRIKPDIVAPGTYILSLRSSLTAHDKFWETQDSYYAFSGGTSMATPIVAGGVAQIRQYLTEKGHRNPSSALIKAMLLTGAEYLPDFSMEEQGFGRANLQAAILTSFVDETKGMRTKDKETYSLEVSDTKTPLVVTLAWTDYPASAVAKRALVNNLNLSVRTPSGEVYNGNDMREPFDNEQDNLNNVEQIWIPKPEKGTYTVTVSGYNIPKGPQPYALVSNADLSSGIGDQKLEQRKRTGTVGTGRSTRPYADYTVTVPQAGPLQITLSWPVEDGGNLNLYLYDSRNKRVASATSTRKNPETITYQVKSPGRYKIRVQARTGSKISYTLEYAYPAK